MEPVYCGVIVIFWPLTLTSWQLNWKSWWPYHLNLVHASTQKLYMITVSYFQARSICHGTCTLSGYCDLLTFSLENMTFTLKFCSGHNSKTMTTASYFEGISTCHWTCALLGYFDLLTLISPLIWKSCPAVCLETINDNCFIFSGHIKLIWYLLSLKLWPLTLKSSSKTLVRHRRGIFSVKIICYVLIMLPFIVSV